MCEQQDLAPVVGLMRKHVGKHRSSGRPRSPPAIPREFCDLPLLPRRQCIAEHAETQRRTSSVGGGSLLHRAAIWVERQGTFQVRRGIPEPGEAGVVKVREDRGNGATTTAFGSRRLGAPSPRVEVRKKELVHRVIDRVGFKQNVSNLYHDLI